MKKHFGQIAFVVLGLAMGWICGNAVGRCMARMDSSMGFGTVLLIMLAVVYGAIFLQMILHEAGHLVFGLLTGYKFVSFRVGSFMWISQDGRIRFRRYSLGGTGGQCLMRPPQMKDGQIPVMLYNLGGSIMNLIVSLLCLGIWAMADGLPVLQMAMMAMVIMGVYMALSNGIPLETKLVANDGMNALTLRKDAEERFGFWLQLELNAQLAQGKRLKDMPEEWFEVPSDEQMKKRHTAVRGVFACNRMLDAFQFAQAAAEIKRLLALESGIIGIHRAQLTCDLATCLLILGDENGEVPALMNKQQKKLMKALSKLPSTVRAEYAVARLLERDEKKAALLMKQFEKLAKNYPYPVEIESERELLKVIDEKAA